LRTASRCRRDRSETPNSAENGDPELDDLGHIAGRAVGHQASAPQIWAMRAILSPNVTMAWGEIHQDVARFDQVEPRQRCRIAAHRSAR
jgi:hypothetical protein